MRIPCLCLLGAAALAAQANAEPAARYQVTFERTWSSETHPKDFPLLAHFSPVIGVTHGADFSLFEEGATATPGMEKLCEEGKHQPLDAELKAAIQRGVAGALIETADPIRSVPGSGVAVFEVDAAHPMVDIGAMIAPSPDWCAVATDVDLRDGAGWVAEKTVTLYPWDMGTDKATSYRAFDDDQQPRGPVQPSDSPYFVKDGKPTPVGTVRFVKQ
jgi:Spondin_N